MARMNCWEFKKCGRQPGGAKVGELGVCPVATEARVHGLNDGQNGGRACWVVSETLCGGKVQGSFATKAAKCMQCDFYALVKGEQGAAFVSSTALLKALG
jgi:hypothetical protein